MKKRYLLFFVFLFFLDLSSKYYVSNFIPKMGASKFVYPYGGIPVFKDFLNGIDFSIVNVENLGAAWGIFSSYSEYLLCARIFIILGLVIYLFLNKLKRGIILLIITGASGNILDFFIYGHVVDMFYFEFWGFSYPIFNVADSLITIGIICLFSFSVQKKSPKYA